MSEKYDFSGWATRNDLKCSDGRTIRRDAFIENDGQTVPLVWQHSHDNPSNVLGHAYLENRPEGVYMYGSFNNTKKGQEAKEAVRHGDVKYLSIYANKLKQSGGDVLHGLIREVSLVLTGANPGARIDNPIIQHDGWEDEAEDEAYITTGYELELYHSEEGKPAEEPKEEKKMAEEKKDSERTVKDVFDEFTEEQKKVVYFMIGQALEDAKGGSDEAKHSDEGEDMKYNAFDDDDEMVLTHDGFTLEQQQTIIKDAKRYGTMKESFLAHSAEYGIENVEYLFPDARNIQNTPDFIKRDDGWVKPFLNATHHVPYSRIKSIHADITEDEARARGYIKGKLKKEEVFSLLKRSTTPTTIYKKQKMDRDDVIDITDFDVIAWLKTEMRGMLDEEIARAVLIGDGRLASSDDKINESNIRPIAKDSDLYTIKVKIPVSSTASDDDKSKAFIKRCIKARKDFKGTGMPIMYTTAERLTDLLLLTDEMGRDLYDSVDKLKTKLMVRDIVTVEVLEDQKIEAGDDEITVEAIFVNPADYTIGADKGGAINMFDDFDIDYNQQKYLIETRCSGALTKPYSAMVVGFVTSSESTEG